MTHRSLAAALLTAAMLTAGTARAQDLADVLPCNTLCKHWMGIADREEAPEAPPAASLPLHPTLPPAPEPVAAATPPQSRPVQPRQPKVATRPAPARLVPPQRPSPASLAHLQHAPTPLPVAISERHLAGSPPVAAAVAPKIAVVTPPTPPGPPLAVGAIAAAPARLAALTTIDVPPALDPALDPAFAAPVRPATTVAVVPAVAPASAPAATEPNSEITVEPRALPATAAQPQSPAVTSPRFAALVYPPPIDVIAAVMLQGGWDHRVPAVGEARTSAP